MPRRKLKESDLTPTLFNTTIPAFGKDKPHIHASDIEIRDLYRQLEDTAYARGSETGYRDGTQCPFDRADVEKALMALGIRKHEIEKAIRHCIDVDFLHQRGEFYHLDRSHLAFYNRTAKHHECP